MTNPLTVAQAYHAAWTAKNFSRAADLLSAQLHVEVPINDYPTKASFVEALASFGTLVTAVDLLAEMGQADEAMQLYDMRVDDLGTIRVVEHFTIADGQIAQLRQIHDTALLTASAARSKTTGRLKEVVE
jgi:SnoaL-like domain